MQEHGAKGFTLFRNCCELFSCPFIGCGFVFCMQGKMAKLVDDKESGCAWMSGVDRLHPLWAKINDAVPEEGIWLESGPDSVLGLFAIVFDRDPA